MNQAYLNYLRLCRDIDKTKVRILNEKERCGHAPKDLETELSVLGVKKGQMQAGISSVTPQEKWQCENYLVGEGTNVSMPDRGAYTWFLDSTIRVFRQYGVPEKWMKNIMDGARSALEQIGLDLKLEYYGVHQSVEDLIQRANNQNGQTNAQDFGDLLASEPYRKRSKGGIPHADIVLIRNHNEAEDGVKRGSHGIGNYGQGYVIMWVSARGSTIHEVGHLLGIPANHDNDRNSAFWKHIQSYSHVDDCVMNWRIPSDKFCGHCKDRLTYLWKGLEKATGMKYFK